MWNASFMHLFFLLSSSHRPSKAGRNVKLFLLVTSLVIVETVIKISECKRLFSLPFFSLFATSYSISFCYLNHKGHSQSNGNPFQLNIHNEGAYYLSVCNLSQVENTGYMLFLLYVCPDTF